MRIIACAALTFLVAAGGCAPKNESPLDASRPVSITLWHYHNAVTREIFDGMVERFNQTAGAQNGVVVNVTTLGDIDRLTAAVFDAAEGKIGANRMPDLFFAYPDTLYYASGKLDLVDMRKYFTPEELSKFQPEFLGQGYAEDGRLLMIPVSKSSEVFYLNRTDWDLFAADEGIPDKTSFVWEEIPELARQYYEWSADRYGRGEAFFGMNSPYEFMLMAARQKQAEPFRIADGKITVNEEVARLVWENYYVPMLKGYFKKVNQFSSDDVRTGEVIAYVGSTAGAGTFPKTVTRGVTSVYKAEPAVYPYPVAQGGGKIAPLRGAGVCMTASDASHEYAAALFLKWFTEPEQNIAFATSTGYLPVRLDALDEALLTHADDLESEVSNSVSIRQCLQVVLQMMDEYQFYSQKPFSGSFELRKLMDNMLEDGIQSTLDKIDGEEKAGADREQLLAAYTSENAFRQWFAQLQALAGQIEV